MPGVKRYFGTDDLTVTPTISNGVAYADGDNIGGLLTFTLRQFNSGGVTYALYVVDADKQAAAIDWYIFRGLPTETFTDNGAFPSLGPASGLLLRGIVPLAAGAYLDIGTASWARVMANDSELNDAVSMRSDTGNIYIAGKVNTSTPTYTGTDKLNVSLVAFYD